MLDLSDRSFRLHVAALCYSARNLTDGLLVDRSVRVLCALTSATRRHLVELVAAGLWTDEADGYLIRDYHDYNPTAVEVKQRRKARSEAGKRGADARWNGKSHGKSHGKSQMPSGAMPHPLPPKEQDQVLLQHRTRNLIDEQLRKAAS